MKFIVWRLADIMYAVFQIAGVQFNAEEGSTVKIPLQDAESGSKIEIEEVLLIKDDSEVTVGTPFVEGAMIEAEIVGHGKDPKVLVHKYKRRKKYRRTTGHRQDFTQLKINRIIRAGN